MSGNKHINENELDELLRDLYLEENTAKINESESDFILNQDYPVEINEEKEKQLLKRLNNKPNRGGFKWIIIGGIILVLAFSVWNFFTFFDYKDSENMSQGSNVNNKQSTENSVAENNAESNNTINAKESIKIKDTFGRPKAISVEGFDTIKIRKQEEAKTKEVIRERSVPFISTGTIVKSRKIKDQMLSRLLNKDKGLYTHIPAAKTVYAGKEIILDGYTLRNVGITNLEYKTFLAELLAQKRNDDYITAEVKTENWMKQGCPDFSLTYFENEKYNDFPVVNVTYDGAALFCKWLQEEIEAYMKRNKIKEKTLTIRMPYDEEWIYAAREGYAKIAFEKGYNTIYDMAEGLVDKTFTKRVDLVKKRVMKVDTMYSQFTTNHYGWSEKEMQDFFGNGFKYYVNAVKDTIYVDRMKVMGKIARVSEMTGQRNGSKLWLSGLSWPLKDDYQKLEGEFKSNLSSPFVGFRIVVIDPNEPEYKNPFW